MKWTLGLLVLIALGCSNNPDALYAKTSRAADSGGPAAPKPEPLPELPALPDEDRQPECKRCAKSNCSEARTNCLEDDDCTDELRCKGKCHDPACLQTCSADFGWSPWYADYANCVFGQCRSECNVGNNWECQGQYDWPAASSGASTFEVVFSFAAPPTYFLGAQTCCSALGDTVRACDDVQECGNSALDSAEIGIDNKVALTLTAGAFQPQDFRGYLELQDSPARIYTAPLSRAQEYFAGALSAGPPPMADLAKARVTGIVIDCLVAPVSNALVTLPDMKDIRAFSIDLNRLEWMEGATSGIGVATLIDLPDSAADASSACARSGGIQSESSRSA